MPKFDWTSGDYNPVLSWQNAMDRAQEILDKAMERGDSYRFEQAAYDVACIQQWVQIAQVHATNANTELLRQLIPQPQIFFNG